MKQHMRPFPILAVLVVCGAFLLAGCGKPVQILSVTGPDSLHTSQTGTFSVNTNEDAKQPVTLAWNFGDNSAGAASQQVTHSFSRPGTYTVSIAATNKRGSDSGTTTVVVYDPPVPAELVSVSGTPLNPDTRTAVRFSSSARGDAPLRYAWDFGDGSTSTSANPTHTYTRPGNYTASLTVSNDHGTDSGTVSIRVSMYEAAICRDLTEMNAAYFDQNSSVLSDDARASLQENVSILQECPNLSIRVQTYAAPGERNAQSLSEDRARAVEQFYTSNGIAASRITAVPMGRVQGVTSKDEGTAQYRRADTIPVR